MSCDGQVVDEVEVYSNGRMRRVAITGYHHDDARLKGGACSGKAWDYYHVEEVVQAKDRTELEVLFPDPFPERPSVAEIQVLLDQAGKDLRAAMLAEVSRGLVKLGDRSDVALWRVEIALLGPGGEVGGEVLAVAPITRALAWLTEGMRQVEDGSDISDAEAAHVQVFEGKCVTCGGEPHYKPE